MCNFKHLNFVFFTDLLLPFLFFFSIYLFDSVYFVFFEGCGVYMGLASKVCVCSTH